jgi:Ni/Fe-hydrogenase 1 B-type cytochrome subunit
MWAIVCFVIVHLYLITREEMMSRQSIFSSMISGYRSYHD